MAEVRLPQSLQVKLKGRSVNSTRVELALYEGHRMVLTLGVSYGHLEGDLLNIKLPVEVARCRRIEPEEGLFLVCSCAGQRLYTQSIQSAEVDWNQLPAVFVEKDDEIRLIGTASVQSQYPELLLRLPAGMQIQDIASVADDASGGHWYRISERRVINHADSSYVIAPGSTAGTTRIELQGTLAPFDTLPASTWLGWPRCQLVDDGGTRKKTEAFRVNNRIFRSVDALPVAGRFTLEMLGEGQQLLARRKLGVLPRDFSIASIPASSQAPARILLCTEHALVVRVVSDNMDFSMRREGGITTLELIPTGQKPDRITLEVTSENGSDGVVLRLPYPQEGAQLMGADGELWQGRDLTLNRILGMTMVLTPRSGKVQSFHVSLELMGQRGGLEKHYSYDVANVPAQVSLFSLYNDILSLFSCSKEQDAVVRCRIETSQLLRQFYIRRYEAVICFKNDSQSFELVDLNGQPLSHRARGARVRAMQVHTPEAESIELQAESTQGLQIGIYSLPPRLQKDGPWLLYPAKDSDIFFRPAIYLPNSAAAETAVEPEIRTLNSAARYYHPKRRPVVFDSVLDDMAADCLHRSWLYLCELKERYAHIPLSAFEAWKHLSRHRQALALAVFRLEIDRTFAERLQQELTVIWEEITIEQWRAAVRRYVQGTSQQFGIPEDTLQNSVCTRMEQLSTQIPLFKHQSGVILEERETNAKEVPLQFLLSEWVGELRIRRQSARWPVNLSEALNCWIQRHRDYAWMQDLQMPTFMRPVCYMPVFAASVTAGTANFSDLSTDDAVVRFGFRVLSDFDRDGWYEPAYTATLAALLQAKRSY